MKPPTFAPVYLSLFPHLAKIANEHGYALAAHGSVQRDMDLVAVPWTNDATSAEELVAAFAKYLRVLDDVFSLALHGPEQKPHGRIAWLLSTGFGSGIDQSVMPRNVNNTAEQQ